MSIFMFSNFSTVFSTLFLTFSINAGVIRTTLNLIEFITTFFIHPQVRLQVYKVFNLLSRWLNWFPLPVRVYLIDPNKQKKRSIPFP